MSGEGRPFHPSIPSSKFLIPEEEDDGMGGRRRLMAVATVYPRVHVIMLPQFVLALRNCFCVVCRNLAEWAMEGQQQQKPNGGTEKKGTSSKLPKRGNIIWINMWPWMLLSPVVVVVVCVLLFLIYFPKELGFIKNIEKERKKEREIFFRNYNPLLLLLLLLSINNSVSNFVEISRWANWDFWALECL